MRATSGSMVSGVHTAGSLVMMSLTFIALSPSRPARARRKRSAREDPRSLPTARHGSLFAPGSQHGTRQRGAPLNAGVRPAVSDGQGPWGSGLGESLRSARLGRTGAGAQAGVTSGLPSLHNRFGDVEPSPRRRQRA